MPGHFLHSSGLQDSSGVIVTVCGLLKWVTMIVEECLCLESWFS